VRIQGFDHAINGTLNKLLGFDGLYIIFIYDIENFTEHLQLLVGLAVQGENRRAAGKEEEQKNGEEADSARDPSIEKSVHSNLRWETGASPDILAILSGVGADVQAPNKNVLRETGLVQGKSIAIM